MLQQRACTLIRSCLNPLRCTWTLPGGADLVTQTAVKEEESAGKRARAATSTESSHVGSGGWGGGRAPPPGAPPPGTGGSAADKQRHLQQVMMVLNEFIAHHQQDLLNKVGVAAALQLVLSHPCSPGKAALVEDPACCHF